MGEWIEFGIRQFRVGVVVEMKLGLIDVDCMNVPVGQSFFVILVFLDGRSRLALLRLLPSLRRPAAWAMGDDAHVISHRRHALSHHLHPGHGCHTSQGFPDGSAVDDRHSSHLGHLVQRFFEWPAMAAMKSARRESEKKTANSLTGFMKSPPNKIKRMIELSRKASGIWVDLVGYSEIIRRGSPRKAFMRWVLVSR